MDNKVILLVSEYGGKYYVLKNSSINLSDKNIITFRNMCKKLNEKLYFKNKLIHREDGPAIIFDGERKEWYKNGLRHRENGPAIEDFFGVFWYQNGLIHRENGPAIENKDGSKKWYKNGELHRLDGPAFDNGQGYEEYYINGDAITEVNFYLEKELRDSLVNNNNINKNKKI